MRSSTPFKELGSSLQSGPQRWRENGVPGSIFCFRDDDKLVEIKETRYDSEDILQGPLVDYYNLLAGDQVDPEQSRHGCL